MSSLDKENLESIKSVLKKSAPFKSHSEKSTPCALQFCKLNLCSSNELKTENEMSHDSKNIGETIVILRQSKDVQLTPESYNL